ncbi:iron-siderophore ABC transporter substrate-binding protein [Xanthobacter sp. TB0136]|uniref:iron-siderophore ABC transporter substrate-binding protein n=1 Tax=Xanthobacter sp. TB0136 TaxID=3459177 RepID=UPI00403A35BA
MRGLSRRAFLAGGAMLAAGGALEASETRFPMQGGFTLPRVATMDWGLLETLLAMGVIPVAAPELVLYRQVVVEPAVPPQVVDIGLRGTPNFEAILRARPSLIFNSSYYVAADPNLRLIAPVKTISIYKNGQMPFVMAQKAAELLAQAVGQPQAGPELIARTDALLAHTRGELAGHGTRPVLIINLGDARHFRVFGPDSMFGEVLERIGLKNAWTDGTSYSASAPVGLEMLARFAEADIIIVPPVPPDAGRVLPQSALWRALPNVREGRVYLIGAMNPFGGLPTAMRCARLVSTALLGGPGGGL